MGHYPCKAYDLLSHGLLNGFTVSGVNSLPLEPASDPIRKCLVTPITFMPPLHLWVSSPGRFVLYHS